MEGGNELTHLIGLFLLFQDFLPRSEDNSNIADWCHCTECYKMLQDVLIQPEVHIHANIETLLQKHLLDNHLEYFHNTTLFTYLCNPGGGLECNLTGRCPFFKNLHNPFRKKNAFRYSVSELLDYKKFKSNGERDI